MHASAAPAEDEDPYGRCLNMKVLSSFEGENGGGPQPTNGGMQQQQQQLQQQQHPSQRKDPRIIDLPAHSTPSSTSVSVASTPRQVWYI